MDAHDKRHHIMSDDTELPDRREFKEEQREQRRKPAGIRIATWTGGIILGLVALVGIVAGIATWWLTPERLTALVNRELSKELDADVKATNVRYTLWSTFPRLGIEADGLYVRSRTLDGLSDSLRRLLPPNADFLMSSGHIRGALNLHSLLAGNIRLRGVEVDSLRLNLVAVTDSVTNYNIVPKGRKKEMPYISADSVRLRGGGYLSYVSLPSAIDASVRLKELSLVELTGKNKRDDYTLRISGNASAQSDGTPLLRDYPFALAGDVRLRFSPFGLETERYSIGVGNIRGLLTLDLELGEKARINRFAYSLREFDIAELKSFLPPGEYPVLDRLDARVAVDASARLTQPYDLSSAVLPSVEVDFKVPDGEVGYTFADNRRYSMRHIGLDGKFVFDGAHPADSYIELPEFAMSGEGVALNMSGRVTGLTSSPTVDARLHGSGDLTRLAGEVSQLRSYGLGGDMTLDAGIRFRLTDGKLTGSLSDIKVKSGKLDFNYQGTRLSLAGFEASTGERYSGPLDRETLLHDIPLNLTAKASGVTVSDKGSGVSVKAGDLKIEGKVSRQNAGEVMRDIELAVSSGRVSVIKGSTRLALNDVSTKVQASRLSHPVKTAPYSGSAKWRRDARTLGFASHTPEVLQVKLPGKATEIMSQWRARLDVKVADGRMSSRGYPAVNRLRDLDVTATFDSVRVNRLTLSSGDTRGTLSARLGNVRQFLVSPTPAPLYVGLDVDIDTIQFNQLARAYTLGHPQSAIARGDKEGMAAGPDTVAVLLPRNIYADIHATAKQTRYINLHLYDLLADIRLADGRADIDTVHVNSDFGDASLRMIYDTSDLQDMHVNAALGISDVDVVSFFNNFQKLLRMMPEMKNLSGNLSADLQARLRIFPSMYLNMPSLWADAHVDGRELKVHQNKFIRHVTDMLLLRSDDDLHIRNIDVHAGVHSNLIEVFPFTFEMSKYRLVMLGLNNFSGDMYYHIGVMNWPLKLPFGINIKGDFKHPELRFGGKNWHDDNGREVLAGVNDTLKVNVFKLAKRYMGEFVHTAAVYDGK